ncbi:MAG: septum formation initiator family protein [Bacteroidales bacterium]|nr:septum formation initiator family protein [Bacteroidales bacterium]
MINWKEIWQKIVAFFKKPYGKYIIALVLFFMLLFLMKDNNLRYYKKLRKQRVELEQEKQTYKDEIKQDSLNTIKLQKNIHEVEKFGREKYMMKKPNEDIYIIKPKSEDTTRKK